MQVVIPMSGIGQRFLDAGYKDPKPLLDVAGRPVIARLLDAFPRDWRFVFVCSEDHLRDTPLKNVLRELVPEAEIKAIPAHKRGPVHAVLAAEGLIDDDLPTLVNYCDFAFSWDPARFLDFTRRTACEGAVLCYKGFHPHSLGKTLYAYCREEGGRVLEIREKGHFTPDRMQEYASSGSYYFSSGRMLKDYCRRAVDEDLKVQGEYYMSMVYDPMLRDGRDVRVYEIPYFLQWGTPQDLEDYLYWHRTFEFLARWSPPEDSEGPRLAMPMAGHGSRFKEQELPKPLIPVQGRPMFLSARRFLPCKKEEPVLVLRRELEEPVRKADPDAKLTVLDAPTQGQADTTLEALRELRAQESVLVSSCDHGLLWDPKAWERLLAQAPDVVVVGQRGYPGARRTPESFAYIDAGPEGRIRKVSVKKPLSPTPQKDLVLVGTFYFRTAALLEENLRALLARDVRVGGERYLDSVVEVCIERGLDVRCFESQSYLNWGSPQALAEFSYWHGYFLGVPA
ncbi:MAG: NTP transferase domain-containing protein [Elusimicrobiota bacterium]|jgi:NDP-sugar pyrophosphorylase family protein